MTWVEVFAAGLLGALIASLFWVLFNTYRIQDLLIRCEEEKDIIRQERNVAEHMVKQADAQMRVLGATPLSKLIGDTDVPK